MSIAKAFTTGRSSGFLARKGTTATIVDVVPQSKYFFSYQRKIRFFLVLGAVFQVKIDQSLVRHSCFFRKPLKLVAFLAERRTHRNAQRLFSAYSGTLSLDELMMKDPAEQERADELTLGGMA